MPTQTDQIQIEGFKPEYLPAFIELNRQWIETHFRIEAMDLRQLERPEETILNIGGEILVATDSKRVFGVCALIPHGTHGFELAKMAVDPLERGRGIGDRLMKAAIGWARAKGARKVTLLSNTVLEPAIKLYRKHGFAVIHLGQHPDYERANIEMELIIDSPKQ